jgi:predicted phage terminase large subunit-like protein
MEDSDDWYKLLETEQELREKASKSLHEFLKQAWPQMEGNKEFSDGWHIGAICEHLEAVFSGQIKNLLVNMPPRSCKSNLISVAWPAWAWINRPHEQFLFASYALSLSIRDSVKCRRLISSPWYQDRWGDRFQLVGDQNTKIKFENDQNGYRIATSVGGSATGEGASYLVCDDPNNALEGESEAKREGANDWFAQVWSTRLNDQRSGGRVIVQQRLHERDISGYVMSLDEDRDWVRLILPMEFEKERCSKTVILPSNPKKVWTDPRKKEGELLWPERIDAAGLKALKVGLQTTYRVAGQLQQRPSPEAGGIIQKSWFKVWKEEKPPRLIQVVQSWDTALEADEENDFSACTTWGIFNDSKDISNLILLGMWRGRVEYPELRHMAQRLYKDYRDDGNIDIKPDGHHVPDLVLVEAKASGHSLIQDLRRAGVQVFKFDPTKRGDKIQRVRLITHILECGKVWVPGRPPEYTKLRKFADTLVELCAMFPNGDSRDVVDTMTQAILRLMESNIVVNSSDYVPTENRKEKKAFYWNA